MAPIHDNTITTIILLGVMRRLNGRKTQSCRSITINDKVTALIIAENKVPGAETLQPCSASCELSK